MSHRYTDVDRMILSRWTEVVGLRGAFDELLERMRDVLEDSLAKLAAHAQELGYSCDHDAKNPSFRFWKKEWETKTWKAPGVSLLVKDFAPMAYGRVRDDHPWMYLDIQEAGKIKVKDRLAFGQAIRSALDAPLRAKWEVADAAIEDFAVGVISREIDDAERLRWMSEPQELQRFMLARMDEAQEIVPAVNVAIEQVGRR